MSRQIKVTDPVYLRLEMLRGKEQTFSQVIEDLLNARLKILEMLNMVEGSLKFRQWQHEQLYPLPLPKSLALAPELIEPILEGGDQ